ncbi:hypothetical protein RSAG8_12260, partial [Rhizoctonia solani AG-8 WAC10335]
MIGFSTISNQPVTWPRPRPRFLMKMAVRLPTELIDLVTQYATTDTRARMTSVSRGVYFISVRALYASIPGMSVARTARCLLTLSKKPDLAHLVHSFSFHLSSSRHFLQAFLILLSRALRNMNNLRVLLLQADVPITINLLVQITCRLTRLTLVIPSEDSYPVSQLLSNPP